MERIKRIISEMSNANVEIFVQDFWHFIINDKIDVKVPFDRLNYQFKLDENDEKYVMVGLPSCSDTTSNSDKASIIAIAHTILANKFIQDEFIRFAKNHIPLS